MKNPVCYYWKEPTTGVELHFTQDSDWGGALDSQTWMFYQTVLMFF